MQRRVNRNIAIAIMPATAFMFLFAIVIWGVILLNRFYASEPVSSEALSKASLCAQELLSSSVSAGAKILGRDLDDAEKVCSLKARLVDKKRP